MSDKLNFYTLDLALKEGDLRLIKRHLGVEDLESILSTDTVNPEKPLNLEGTRYQSRIYKIANGKRNRVHIESMVSFLIKEEEHYTLCYNIEGSPREE